MSHAARPWRSLNLGVSDPKAGCHLGSPLWPLPPLVGAGPLCNFGGNSSNSGVKPSLCVLCTLSQTQRQHWTCATSPGPFQRGNIPCPSHTAGKWQSPGWNSQLTALTPGQGSSHFQYHRVVALRACKFLCQTDLKGWPLGFHHQPQREREQGHFLTDHAPSPLSGMALSAWPQDLQG